MKIEIIQGLGEVTYTKRKKSRRITVKIEPNNKIKVSHPSYISHKVARNYLLNNLNVIQQKAAKLNEKTITFNEDSIFKTKWHKLIIEKKEIDNVEYYISEYSILVYYPAGRDINDTYVQESIKEAIVETLRIEAQSYLPQRLLATATKFNLHYNKVFIKNIKTQWGSCSYKNNINLNLHIMRLPNHLIDYVICHELCHTVHKNHSPAFWNMLSTLMEDDIKTIKNELRSYSPQLYSS